MYVCKGDMVQVIAGNSRYHGKVGKVLSVFPKEERLVVEGVNMMKRHTKPSSANQQGGIIEKEGKIHMSNVMPYCESAGRPSKIVMKRQDGGKRVRVYKINGETVKDPN